MCIYFVGGPCIYTAVKVYEVILMVTVNIIQTSSLVFGFLQEVAETTGKPQKMTVHLNTWHGNVLIYGKLRFLLLIKRRIMSHEQTIGYVNCACSFPINFHISKIQVSWHRTPKCRIAWRCIQWTINQLTMPQRLMKIEWNLNGLTASFPTLAKAE